MARVQTIIVGGGVGAVAPFTTGTIPLVSSSDPPALSDSIIVQQSVTEIIIGTDPDATATEKLRLSGGAMIAAAFGGVAIAGTVAIGKGAGVSTANKTGNICIGLTAVVSHASAACIRNVVIGDLAVISSSGSNQSVCIGAGASITGAASGICIGGGAIISAGAGIAIGTGASTSQNATVAIGASADASQPNSTAIGEASQAGGNPSTALGSGCAIAASGNGGVAVGLSNSIGAHAGCLLIGRGLTSIAANHCMIGSTTSAQDYRTFVLGGGDTLGSAVAARTIRFTNASGANITAGDVTFIAPRATGNVAGGSFVFQTGAVGVSGSTLQVATTQFTILTSAGGAGVPNLRIDNVTTGAGAGAGTITNAPTAGNPTFWLPININGTVLYIPCWP